MLRLALRRTLWAIPTLVGITLVVFFVTTLIPDPVAALLPSQVPSPAAGGPPVDRSVADILTARRRAHFLDLPRFINTHPEDVRSRAEGDLRAIVEGAAASPTGDDPARELSRLGGAALPYVLPSLEKLRPADRGRVAAALAPIAERMGFTGTRFDDPEAASRFWARFWEDRAVDFTIPAVGRVVRRIAEDETDLRIRDVLELDTFALPDLVGAIEATDDRLALTRLSGLASHVSGRHVVLAPDAGEAAVRRLKGDWQEWWFVHREDYVAIDGGARLAARFLDTRYGKWVLRGFGGRLGVSSRDGEPILDKLLRRAPITFALTGLSLLLSYAIAIPFGVVAAIRRGEAVDLLVAAILFALYALPTFWVAELLAHTFAATGRGPLVPGVGTAPAGFTRESFILGVAALSVGGVALLSRYERAALLEVLRQDYIRTARAKGVPGYRVLIVHALRNALMPVVTLAGLQLPTSFGGAFVVEEVFRLPGMGYETLRAVEAHDAAWLTTVLLVLSVVAMMGLILTDVAAGALDPRVRDVMLARAGGTRS
jgi:ABC-type dipeptide/oligopeptide/nickel transport system permease component